MKYTELRIRNRDSRNWTIEGYQSGGEIIERGRFVGQEKQEKWDELNPIGYFPTLAHAAKRLLDEHLRRVWPEDGWQGEDLTAAIAAAEERVVAAVHEALEARGESGKVATTGPVWDITPEQAEEIRTAHDPSQAWLSITGGRRFKRTSDETRRNLKPSEAALERAVRILGE
jgi:hypothetical protein